MTINREKQDSKLTLSVSGRLDTSTAPSLEEVITQELGGISELVLDFDGLEYISSAGLRVILCAQKTMNKQGEMTIMHSNDDIKEIFDITGFSDILTLVD